MGRWRIRERLQLAQGLRNGIRAPKSPLAHQEYQITTTTIIALI
jgi:hypothetical protein